MIIRRGMIEKFSKFVLNCFIIHRDAQNCPFTDVEFLFHFTIKNLHYQNLQIQDTFCKLNFDMSLFDIQVVQISLNCHFPPFEK